MVNLHLHTKYSLLDAIIKIDELMDRLVELGQTACAITDHGNMYGAVEFYKTAKEHGIKPIIGCEVYICSDVTIMKRENKMYHLILLAKNEEGRLNLQKLVTESTRYKFNKRPRIDFEMLTKYHNGLICCSACMVGEVAWALKNEDKEEAYDIARRYKDLFGDDYYIEYQSHRDPVQQQLNRQLVQLAMDLGIKYVVTCDSHYLNQEDQKYHNIFVQIGQSRETGETYNDCFVQSEEEIYQFCESTTEFNAQAIANTHEIADKCNVEYPLSAPIIPHTHIPDKYKSEEDYLKQLCNEGWVSKGFSSWTLEQWKKYMTEDIYDENGKLVEKREFISFNSVDEITQIYFDRLRYEMESVVKMGFEGYYLLVRSYISSAYRRGIARGSAGGSLIAYLCGIVDIDPIKYGLYFERFIDVGALDLLDAGTITKKELKIPDVDADFSTTNREKVMKFIVDSYGENNVVCLGTFQYIWAKGSIKDIGKVLGIPFEITNEITKNLGDESIDEALELGLLDDYKDKYPELFTYASKLAGLPKTYGTHACFTEDTMVLTRQGYKKIKDIQVGDFVLTHKNNYKLVVNTMCRKDDTICIEHMNGFSINCTKNHPFLVRHRIKKQPRKYSDMEWVNADQLQKSDMICYPINNECVVPTFPNIDLYNQNFWWIIGRYIGDGWCEYHERPRNEKRVIICCNKNNDKLDNITQRLEGIFDYWVEEADTTYKIHIKSVDLFCFLQQFGKYANKKHLTQNIIDLPYYLLKSFLDGYISADGYIDKDGFVNIKTVSRELAQGIIQCVAKVYHKNCNVHILSPGIDIIQGRKVNRKEKYLLYFKKDNTNKDKCFYDEDNKCMWVYVKSITNNSQVSDVYNLSVVDDNTYTANGIAVHNCGKVITMQEAMYYNALEYNANENTYSLQGDMHTADDLGLVKIDLLGLRTLDVIYDVLKMIGKDYNYIAPHTIDLSDTAVWKEFMNGNSLQIFQFESQGMRQMLKDMRCNSIDDLSAANALYRPGSKDYIPNYIARKNGTEPIRYINPMVENILKPTYGIIVYQEQLIEIGRLAGLRNPDELRQATAKKKIKLMAKIEPEMKQGLIDKGWTQDQVDQLWDDIIKFAKYSFNKSHSCAYGLTAYITMFLKVHYPAEFITASINSYDGKTDKIAEVINEAKRMGVVCKFDNWRNITPTTICKDGVVYLGTNIVKGFGKEVANELNRVAQTNPQNFIDFLMNYNSKDVEKMIYLDWFSEYGEPNELAFIYSKFNELYVKGSGFKKNIKQLKLGLDPEFVEPYCDEYKPATVKEVNIEAMQAALLGDVNKLTEFNDILVQCERHKKTGEFNGYDYEKLFKLTKMPDDIKKRFATKVSEAEYKGINGYRLLTNFKYNGAPFSVKQRINAQLEYLSYINYTDPTKDKRTIVVCGLDTKYSPKFTAYCLNNGETCPMKVRKTRTKKGSLVFTTFQEKPFDNGDVLYMKQVKREPKAKNVDGVWTYDKTDTEWWLYGYDILNV